MPVFIASYVCIYRTGQYFLSTNLKSYPEFNTTNVFNPYWFFSCPFPSCLRTPCDFTVLIAIPRHSMSPEQSCSLCVICRLFFWKYFFNTKELAPHNAWLHHMLLLCFLWDYLTYKHTLLPEDKGKRHQAKEILACPKSMLRGVNRCTHDAERAWMKQVLSLTGKRP